VNATSPLRGPKEHRRRRLRPRSFPSTPRRIRGRPSGPKGAPHRAARDSPSGPALDPGDHCGPWGRQERAGPGLPRQRPARKPPAAAARAPRTRGKQTNWRPVTQKAENNRYPSQALESVKHHLKPNRQRSVGPRHRLGPRRVRSFCTSSRRPAGPLAPPPRRARLRSRWRSRYVGANAGRLARKRQDARTAIDV